MSSHAKPSAPTEDPSERVTLSVVPSPDPTQLSQQASLRRRLGAALFGLGFAPEAVRGLVGPDQTGFADLSVAAAGRLVRQVEDLATSRDQPWLRSGPSGPSDPQQLSLF